MTITISKLSIGVAITDAIAAANARLYKRVWTSDFCKDVAIMSLIKYATA